MMRYFLATIAIIFVDVTHSRECHFVDVKNSVGALRVLQNCTAVLGFLSISLVRGAPKDFANVSFPELREVTGFMLVHRVPGILTLRNLFPNLQIIRGNEILFNHALILHDLNNITEVGLPSLQSIPKGNVRVENCPKICDADTFDFKTINTTNFLNHYGQSCTGKSNYKIKETVKPQEIPLKECHELCMFGCYNSTAAGCHVCKGPRNDGVCVDTCPEDKLYDELTMRCITHEQCNKTRNPSKKFIFEEKKLCVDVCPKGFTEKDPKNNYELYKDGKCHICEVKCTKICHGADITSLGDARKLHGCNLITGALHININSSADRPDLMEELTKYFESVEEITGDLKIFRSFPITSLDFLKNLRVIHGEDSQNNLALFVFENNNLQAIWDPHPDFRVLNGSVLFSSNEKLCPSLVEDFLKDIKQNSSRINIESNGSRSSCNATKLEAKHKVISWGNVTIYWKEFQEQTKEKLLGYVINHIETRDTNLTHFYGTYSCSMNSWVTIPVELSEAIRTPDNYLAYNITGLASRTQYAFYVRTDFGGSFRNQGQSAIHYFKTPLNTLNAVSKKDREYIQNFYVDILRQPDDLVLQNRDFCDYPHEYEDDIKEVMEEKTRLDLCCCPRDDEDEESFDEGEYESPFETMDDDDNTPEVYDIKKYENYVSTRTFLANESVSEDANWFQYEITGLTPFTLYAFQLFACGEANQKKCGPYALHSERTIQHNVEPVMVVFENTTDTVTFNFTAQKETNGGIVACVVEIKLQQDESSFLSYPECFPLAQETAWNRTFNLMVNYTNSFRFRSVSLSGDGPFTDWYTFGTQIFESTTTSTTPKPPTEKPSDFGSFLTALFLSIVICGSVYGTIWFKPTWFTVCRRKSSSDKNDMEMLVLGFHDANVDDDLFDNIPLDNISFREADFY